MYQPQAVRLQKMSSLNKCLPFSTSTEDIEIIVIQINCS